MVSNKLKCHYRSFYVFGKSSALEWSVINSMGRGWGGGVEGG